MKIIGGGIAGSLAAIELLRRGYSVTIFHLPREKPCSGLLTEEAFRFLSTFFDPREAVERIVEKIIVGREIKKKLYVVDRKLLDALARQAAEEEGAKIVNRAEISGDIGADGFYSRFAKHYGFPEHKKPFLGALRYTSEKSDTIIVKGHSWGFEWKIPRKNGTEIGMMGTVEKIAHLVSEEWKIWPIPSRLRKKIQIGKKYLIGDAAGTIKPLSGGGIFYSALAAKALADSLEKNLSYEDHPIIKWIRIQQKLQLIAFKFWFASDILSHFHFAFHQDFLFPLFKPPLEISVKPEYQNLETQDRKDFPSE